MGELQTEQQNAIIADYLRFYNRNNDENKSNDDIIDQYGGDTSNLILCDFGNGKMLYESVDNSHGLFKTYTILDIKDYSNSYVGECIEY